MEIQRLPDHVVDQIAAGEVVERPAHLVKELIENSLDAKATQITVEIENGGRNIRVVDNGLGIARDQLSSALGRHCTSKIRDTSDLWQLSSFGFRGEALATISAVSRFQIFSKTKNSEEGSRVVCNFGKVDSSETYASNVGTTVIVEDLFENVPARLKFMKSPSSEITQIRSVVQALALSHPKTEFQLRSQGKVIDFIPQAQDSLQRVKQVIEQSEVFHATGNVLGVQSDIFYCSPHVVKGNSKGIWLFAQNRWIQDRGLQAAVMDAYRGLLMHGEYPVVVVFVNCDPREIDVNIHPTKSQIKFRDNKSSFRSVHSTLREAIESAPWVKKQLPQTPSEVESVGMPAAPSTNLEFSSREFETVQVRQKVLTPTQQYSPLPLEEKSEGTSWSTLKVIGQAHLTYILTESADALILVDQHAAHERVMYERLMKSYLGAPCEVQNYLLPLTVSLEADLVDALVANEAQWTKLNISLDRGGNETVVVRSAPAWLSEESLSASLQKIAREILEAGGSLAAEKIIGDICASLACHSAIRAGQALSQEEMTSLLNQMDEFPLSGFCPHGRPVSVELPIARIERDFGRIQ